MKFFIPYWILLTTISFSNSILFPKIEIMNGIKVRTDNNHNMTIVEKSQGHIGVSCSASYPIDWDFSGIMKINENISAYSFRILNEMNESIFINNILIMSSHTVNGNYKCSSIQNLSIFSSIYLVFEETNNNIFSSDTLKNEDIFNEVNYSDKDTSVILPCPASNPFVNVTLFRDENVLEYKKDYDYNPKLGIILYKTKLVEHDFSGNYICHLQDHDEIKFNLIYSPLLNIEPEGEFVVLTKKEFQFICRSSKPIYITTTDFTPDHNQIHCNYTDILDSEKNIIYTCSLSSKHLTSTHGLVSCFAHENWKLLHTWKFIKKDTLKLEFTRNHIQCKSDIPTVLVNMECANPTECELRRGCLNNYNSCGKIINTGKMDNTYVTSVLDMRHVHKSGMFKCSNEYGEIEQMYFTSLQEPDNSLTIYTDWLEAWNKNDLISISIELDNLDNTDKVYMGSWIRLTCSFNIFVFSKSYPTNLNLYIRLQNDDEIPFPNGTSINVLSDDLPSMYKKDIIELYMIKIYRKDITHIICMGPIWNSTEWLNKSLPINVTDSVQPSIINLKKHYQFYMEDNIAYMVPCETTGSPKPVITWFNPSGIQILKDTDKAVPVMTESDVNIRQTSYSIRFPSHSKTFDGVYTCEAKNEGGSVSIPFKVEFLSGRTYGASYYLMFVVLPIIIILLLVTVTVLWLRLRSRNKKFRELTYSELDEFENGKQIETNGQENLHTIAESLPFKNEFEVARNTFVFEEKKSSILGSGAFGYVYKGTYGQDSTVAIKTVKPSTEIVYFKALLSELKLIAYIGEHPNIVRFIGACTQYIRQRTLFIILEYCENGSLLNFLEKHRNSFKNLIEDDKIIIRKDQSRHDYMNDSVVLDVNPVSTLDLIRFSIQIINGLQYLRLRKVIHGDLAARNILLDGSLVAKLADFGLSRQLNNCANYVKKSREPLPWRYMAIESLRSSKFSYESDVWGLGVTLWEIFSLGHVPYPGMSYIPEFVEQISKGMRMSPPEFATLSLYQEVILQCWQNEPGDRITLDSAKRFLSDIYRNSTYSNYEVPIPAAECSKHFSEVNTINVLTSMPSPSTLEIDMENFD